MQKQNNCIAPRFSVPRNFLRFNRRSDKDTPASKEESGGGGSVDNMSDKSAPLFFSPVNYFRKTKGPAPVVSIDSLLELPLLNNTSTSDTHSTNDESSAKR